MEQHAMVRVGEDEWECPTCKHKVKVSWDPFRLKTLEPGDKNATHSGALCMPGMNLVMGQSAVNSGSPQWMRDLFGLD